MIHEMTKLELEVRYSSSPSFRYLPTSNKTGPFEYPCVYIYIYLCIRVVTPQRERTKSTAGRKETKCSNDLLHPKLLGSKKKEVSEKKEIYISPLLFILYHYTQSSRYLFTD